MSRDRAYPAVSPAEWDRLRAIVGRLDDEDSARIDPPVELWGRIAAAVASESVASDAASAVNRPPAGALAATLDPAGDGDDAVRDRLRAIAVRLDHEDFARVVPPAELWGRIAAAVASETDAEATPADPRIVEPPRPEPVVPVVSLDAHRRRRHRRVLAAAAAAVVVVAMTVAVLTRGGSSPTGDEPELVASTELEPLEPVGGASAEVRLVRQDDQLELELEARNMAAAPQGQHYELWLLDPSSATAEPVSLGTMSGSTSVAVPEGVDPDAYDVVDVSLQEAGQSEHSGHSLLRGTLA